MSTLDRTRSRFLGEDVLIIIVIIIIIIIIFIEYISGTPSRCEFRELNIFRIKIKRKSVWNYHHHRPFTTTAVADEHPHTHTYFYHCQGRRCDVNTSPSSSSSPPLPPYLHCPCGRSICWWPSRPSCPGTWPSAFPRSPHTTGCRCSSPSRKTLQQNHVLKHH